MIKLLSKLLIKKDIALFFICYIFFILFISCNNNKTSLFDKNTVLSINNTPVSIQEYNLFLDEEKAMTYNYFYQKYKVDNSKNFWTSRYSGESPIVHLKEKANERLKQIKFIQNYAAKMNLINLDNFDVFIKDWQNNNAKRKKKHKAGEIVYGPIHTNLRDYYFYIHSNLEIQLKDQLNRTVFIPSDTELKNFFNKIKNSHFTYIDTISVELLSFPFKTLKEREHCLKLANKASNLALTNNSLQQIQKKIKEGNYQQKYFLDDVQLYGEENIDREIIKKSSILKEGEIKILAPKGIVNSNIYVIKLLKPNKIKIRNFNEVSKEVLYFYKENKYKQLIDSLQKNIVVSFNKNIYEKITIKK